jgi:hypothetical protein
VLQQLADAGRHENPPGLDRGLGHLAEHRGRRAFDNHLGALGQLGQRQHRHLPGKRAHPLPRALPVARADGDQLQAGHAFVQALGQRAADRAKAGEGDAKQGLRGHHRGSGGGMVKVGAPG